MLGGEAEENAAVDSWYGEDDSYDPADYVEPETDTGYYDAG